MISDTPMLISLQIREVRLLGIGLSRQKGCVEQPQLYRFTLTTLEQLLGWCEKEDFLAGGGFLTRQFFLVHRISFSVSVQTYFKKCIRAVLRCVYKNTQNTVTAA